MWARMRAHWGPKPFAPPCCALLFPLAPRPGWVLDAVLPPSFLGCAVLLVTLMGWLIGALMACAGTALPPSMGWAEAALM